MTWETCSLRSWLNSTFLTEGFSSLEQKMILKTTVDNSENQGNSEWTTNGGNYTADQIFLLSYAEVGKYFASETDRTCKPTSYVKAQRADISSIITTYGNCTWWLRSPGPVQYWAAVVSPNGALGGGSIVYYDRNTVRPAFWIDLESDIF